MITTLIFDLDGTIADTEKLHFQAWQKTLLDHGVPRFSFEDFCHYIGTSNEKVAADHCAPYKMAISEKELISYKQSLYIELIPQVELCAGAKNLIEECAPHFKMAVASSSHEREVRAILKSHDLLKHFQTVVCGDMVSKRKPDPEIYLKTAGILESTPESCIAFEDTEHGLNAAKAAGMYGIAIPTPYSPSHDFSKANTLLKNLTEIDLKTLQNLRP